MGKIIALANQKGGVGRDDFLPADGAVGEFLQRLDKGLLADIPAFRLVKQPFGAVAVDELFNLVYPQGVESGPAFVRIEVQQHAAEIEDDGADCLVSLVQVQPFVHAIAQQVIFRQSVRL